MKGLFTLVALLLQLSVSAQVLPDSAKVNSRLPVIGLISTQAPPEQVPVKLPYWESHYRAKKVISRSLIVLASGSAVGVISYNFVDEPLREFTLLHRCDASSKVTAVLQPLGHSGYMIPAGGMVYASGLALRNQKLQRTGILLVSSMLINDLATSQLKHEFQRRRPDEANHNNYFEIGDYGRKYASFPSAHTSTAFAFATSIATVYHDHKWVPAVAYGTASLVGLSRIHDNKHWTTDVLAGAALGYISAKTTNYILTKVEDQLVHHKVNIYLLPNVSTGATGLSFGGSF